MSKVIWKKRDLSKNNSLEKELGVPKLISELLSQRGINDFESAKAFFRPSLNNLHDPFLMNQMKEAVIRINKAKLNNEPIMIYGDYDVDGTTAVSLMYLFLSNFFENIIPYMPDRYKEGYGISINGINFAKEKGINLIIALDCGIKAVENVRYANENKIDFIICDHHKPGIELPNAVAILNPKKSNCNYPFKDLCGCGIGFKLVQALSMQWDINFDIVTDYLDLVAIATVSDLVPIVGENRILCYHGMKKLNETNKPGLKKFLSLSKSSINTSDISFKIAPRINSAGRIDHSLEAFKLLTYNEIIDVEKQFIKIEKFNENRRLIDEETTKEAIKIVENSKIKSNTTVVSSENWHKGVIGIVASRLIENYYKPTIVFTSSGDNYVGSVRSVRDFDVYKTLEMSKKYIVNFGGHKYAAGVTVSKSKFNEFKNEFEKIVSVQLKSDQKQRVFFYDLELDLKDITLKVLRIINQMSPFGSGNSKPMFKTCRCLIKGNPERVGREDKHLKLEIGDNNNNSFRAIAFGKGYMYDDIKKSDSLDILYSIEENSWNGESQIQLKIKDIVVN